MGWTKRQICEEAYAELALSGYTFDLQPEEMQRAGRRLDLMMAAWDAMGVQLGYSQSSSPDTLDLDADSGLSLIAVSAAVPNLAIVLCPGEGKGPHQVTLDKAKEGLDNLKAAAAYPREQQLRAGLPLGAGNKGSPTYGRIFVPDPDTSPLQNADNGDLDFVG